MIYTISITRKSLFFFLLLISTLAAQAQTRRFSIIAYYAAGPEAVDSIPAEKLTHIIYSFCHLKGNRLNVDNGRDSLTIQKLVGLKSRNAELKVILSLGGWGGCPTCSDVFSTAKGREEFSQSTLELNQYFGSDGIDLDWEYPAIEGHPGHKYGPDDLKNFTALVQELRRKLGKNYEISFAAGGFQKFLDESVEWIPVMTQCDRVNIMSYDLVNGYATVTGHHTPLYSTKKQHESTDDAVQYLIKLGVPREKLVIGAAFYARVWEKVPAKNKGLYQPGKFKMGIDYKKFGTELSLKSGFVHYWDDEAKAPYAYNEKKKLYATFDDKKSIALKTQYALDQQLDGIMFWELSHDTKNGLVDVMYKLKQEAVAEKKQ